ncbi:hypothetical protein LCGC14_2996150, partial [marine sediment metagenome]
HDSSVESTHGYQYGPRGYPANKPDQPVVRITWKQASAYCQWLSKKTGAKVTLPTEAQWEYACRAGTDTDFHFGDVDADFSPYANIADIKLRDLAVQIGGIYDGKPHLAPIRNPTKYDDWVPRSNRFNDGALVTGPVGSYQPNAWGLHDMHGNVAEWTRSTYLPYPYNSNTSDESRSSTKSEKVVRGGSWRDRPYYVRSGYRLSYSPWQGVYNVGFRVLLEVEDKSPAVGAGNR